MDIFSTSDPTPAEASRHARGRSGVGSHINYIRQLQQKQPPKPPLERFGAGYQDYLQNPLQPLADNLESITYEVFEKDPIKYEWYERAIFFALQDWTKNGKPASGPNGRIVVAVVGAGRGPLVTRALQASAAVNAEIELWAVEKNPNAFVLLQQRNVDAWGQRVHLSQSDMRSWEGPVYSTSTTSATCPRRVEGDQSTSTVTHCRIDILVSELLGSFGDNELSPECLDGVQHLLNPKDGLSIPSSYSAYLSPIAAPKLHSDILARTASGDSDASQIPYVVMLSAMDFLSTNPLDPAYNKHEAPLPVVLRAWEFAHGSRESHGVMSKDGEHNRRFARVEFNCKNRGVCHGLAGYFEAVLFAPSGAAKTEGGVKLAKDQDDKQGETDAAQEIEEEEPRTVELSTNPLTLEQKSKDMISWFPMYFPLKVQAPCILPLCALTAATITDEVELNRPRSTFPTTRYCASACGGRRTAERYGTSG